MILQCPQCQARFAVPDTAIPPAGRVVKCGRCSNSWHATIVDAVATPVVASTAFDAVVETIVEPLAAQPQKKAAAAKEKKINAVSGKVFPIPKLPLVVATPILALSWLVLAVVGHYPSWMGAPVVGKIYDTLGIQSTDGLVFDDVTMQRVDKEGKTNYVIAGSIANQSSTDRVVPSVRVMLNDASGKKLWMREYVVNEAIKGGGVYPFRIANVETAFGNKVASIVVDVGHSLQLMMR